MKLLVSSFVKTSSDILICRHILLFQSRGRCLIQCSDMLHSTPLDWMKHKGWSLPGLPVVLDDLGVSPTCIQRCPCCSCLPIDFPNRKVQLKYWFASLRLQKPRWNYLKKIQVLYSNHFLTIRRTSYIALL